MEVSDFLQHFWHSVGAFITSMYPNPVDTMIDENIQIMFDRECLRQSVL